MARVLYIGNYAAPWCTEVHLAAEMELLGHTVDRLQEPSRPGPYILDLIRAHALAGNADLVMWSRTQFHMPPELTSLWRELEAAGIVTCSYHLDLYLGLKREDTLLADPFWTTQHVFTPDGNPPSEQWFQERGINHHYLMPAVYSGGCYRAEPDPRYAFDVAFVGSSWEYYHPEWTWRRELQEALQEWYGPRYHRFGYPEPQVREHGLNQLYSTVKVVVGDTLSLPGNTHYVSDRYFETVGRGGFLIAPRIECTRPLWPYMATYQIGDLDGLHASIEHWLAQDRARQVMQEAGSAFVARKHTYRHRLVEAFEIMGLS